MELPPAPTPFPASTPPFKGPGCLGYLRSAAGSVLIGVTLPTLLVILRCIHKPHMNSDVYSNIGPIGVFCAASIGCTPGTIVLSTILLSNLVNGKDLGSLRQAMKRGAISGVLMALCNLPAYLVFAILEDDDLIVLRVALLFAVAGSTCGMWIAWQAWRARNAEARFLPRFTLKTLLLFVFIWGSVMVVFQPRQWNKAEHEGSAGLYQGP